MSADENKSTLASNFQNDGVAIGAAGSMTFNMGKGTDTATDRYLNLPGGYSYGLEVIPTVACSITEINGRPMKVAISVPVNGYVPKTGKFQSIKIAAGSATVVEVHGRS